MAEHKPLYRGSFNEAVRLGEADQWRASWHENIACRDFIDQSIAQNYDGHRLGGDVAGDVIAKFGYDRVNWLLANTIRMKDHDGRFSAANKEWARGFYFEADDIHRHDWVIDQSHPGLVDLVVRDVRQAYDQLQLFTATQCDSVFDFDTVAGQVLVLKPEMLKDEYKAPEQQLFLASHGNGCKSNAIGRSIFGEFLIDGEKDRYWRQDFFGVLKQEHMPAWAAEKMAQPEPEQGPEPVRIKVFQINSDRNTGHRRFEGIEPGQAVDSSIYDEVYDGPAPSDDLEAIYSRFNGEMHPPLHRGWSMSVGDVVEVGGAYHYVNPVGFEPIAFDASLTQKPDGLLRVVVLEPGLPAYEGEIGPDLKSMQRAVGGGLIEVTCPFADSVAVVGNDEAKLIGMEGNRHIAGQVYAGPLFIVGDDGEGGFCSLTNEQVAGYCQQFAQPEDITQEEVQADMGIKFYGM